MVTQGSCEHEKGQMHASFDVQPFISHINFKAQSCIFPPQRDGLGLSGPGIPSMFKHAILKSAEHAIFKKRRQENFPLPPAKGNHCWISGNLPPPLATSPPAATSLRKSTTCNNIVAPRESSDRR
jgi:hypothetical protein